jgi:chromosome segregation ATPase
MTAWPDWDEFVRRLREDPAFREEVRRQVLTEDLLNLPAVVQAGLAALTEQVRENGRQIASLTERMERAEAQIQENGRQIATLTEQVRENSRQIAALTEALREFRNAAERRFAAAEAQIAENGRLIAALTEQVRENSRQIAENSRHIATLTDRVEENSRQIGTLEGRVGWLMGHSFEQRYLFSVSG